MIRGSFKYFVRIGFSFHAPITTNGAFVTKNRSTAQGQARPGPGCGTFKIFIGLTVCNFGVSSVCEAFF